MQFKKVLAIVAYSLSSLAVLAGPASSAKEKAPDKMTPLKESLVPAKEQFNREMGKVRLVALLSPT